MQDPIPHTSSPRLTSYPDLAGKDEMNLAEFPLTKLGSRDKRDVLTFTSWVKEQRKPAHRQVWTVRGATGLGLPNELGDRVMLALIALHFQQDVTTRKVTFSRYELLKIMGLDPQGSHLYDKLETVLRQLTGITIESERAFFDKSLHKRITSREAFHLIEKLWLRKYEADADRRAMEQAQGYIRWSQQFWASLHAGYIKRLDLDFYYSLPTPLARRLYRFLDKRMCYRNQMEIDIFELSGRLGQTRYRKPSETYRKLKPAIAQLIERRFLTSAETVKRQKYTRVRFVKAPAEKAAEFHQQQRAHRQRVDRLRQTYATREQDTEHWQKVLDLLAQSLSPAQCAMVAQSELLAFADARAIVGLPHALAMAWVRKQPNVLSAMQEALAAVTATRCEAVAFVDLKSADSRPDC